MVLNLFSCFAIAQEMVKDIAPGYNTSYPLLLCSTNGVVFFAADDKVNGNELWKTDGTAAGTLMVKDINPAGSGLYNVKIVAMEGNVYFVADDGINSGELWKSDGTSSGTIMVKNIRTGVFPSQIEGIFEYNGAVYFSADDGINGAELWKSDGTSAGTIMVKDILPGQYSGITANPFEFVKFNNMLYFSARDNTGSSPTLWKTDGTGSGTIKVVTSKIKFALEPKSLTEYNGNLYFNAYTIDTNGNNIGGTELYKTDGTDTGTALVKDIYPANYQSSYPQNFTVANNLLFFTADDGVQGRELWKTDGSPSGTVIVKDIYPGSNTGPYYALGEKMVIINKNLYFTANDGLNGNELWKSDGTATNTLMIKDIRSGSPSSIHPNNELFVINSMVYFSAHNGTLGYELWKSDGTSIGTTLVKDIMPPGYTSSSSSNPSGFFNNNGVLYFVAENGPNGQELWKYNTTLGINENYKNEIGITVYPNPTKGIINVELTDLKETEFSFYNVAGQKVFTKKINEKNSKLDLNKFDKGVYFLNFKNNNGASVQKIILDK
jgi:ELWxxDGT repeat protein